MNNTWPSFDLISWKLTIKLYLSLFPFYFLAKRERKTGFGYTHQNKSVAQHNDEIAKENNLHTLKDWEIPGAHD